MTREIKFRAFHKDPELKMKAVTDIFFNDLGNIDRKSQVKLRDYDWVYVKDIKLMQYTGLKSKSGVEIYEGDILKWHDSGDILEVRWINNAWEVHGSYNQFANHAWEDAEVIGNVWENPELLEENK